MAVPEALPAAAASASQEVSPVWREYERARAITDAYVRPAIQDDIGGFVLDYLVPVSAPVHVKLGLRNATAVYPSGLHLETVAAVQAREKVRRPALVDHLVRELVPERVVQEVEA